MPDAPLRPCNGRCGRLVRARYCDACASRSHATRRQSRNLTYAESWWRRWRIWFIQQLVAQDIVPVCGARLPRVAPAFRTPCQDQGLETWLSSDGSSVHLHHEPELTEAEQTNRQAVCDERRIVLACDRCHNAIDAARRAA